MVGERWVSITARVGKVVEGDGFCMDLRVGFGSTQDFVLAYQILSSPTVILLQCFPFLLTVVINAQGTIKAQGALEAKVSKTQT